MEKKRRKNRRQRRFKIARATLLLGAASVRVPPSDRARRLTFAPKEFPVSDVFCVSESAGRQKDPQKAFCTTTIIVQEAMYVLYM